MNHRPNALDCPQYVEAVIQERLVRDAAFLGITERISDFRVVPLTLRHFLSLRVVGHPLLVGQIPSPQQLADFLWNLSPDRKVARAKRRFMRRCRKTFFPPRYLALLNTYRARLRFRLKRLHRFAAAARIIEAAKGYVEEALQDRPPVQAARIGIYEPDYYSDAAAFCALFAREFGWTQEQTLSLPMKCIFQYLNERSTANGSRVPLCNPSDTVKARFYRDLNAQLRADRKGAR